MMHRRRVRGIAFDLDGVLIDSAGCHRAAFKEVLSPLGVTDFDYSRYAGWRTPEVIETEFRRIGRPVDQEEVAATAARKSSLAREKLAATNPVFSDSLVVLRQLAGEYALALATSGSRGTVEIFLAANGCRTLFQSILTGEDVQRAKPDPEIYRKTFTALGLDSSVCVVVEDAVAGIQAAGAAGAIAVGLTGTCPRETLSQAGATLVIDFLRELPDLLAHL